MGSAVLYWPLSQSPALLGRHLHFMALKCIGLPLDGLFPVLRSPISPALIRRRFRALRSVSAAVKPFARGHSSYLASRDIVFESYMSAVCRVLRPGS